MSILEHPAPVNQIPSGFVDIDRPNSPDERRFAYPVSLDLHGVPVLVVGAGPVAARKVAGLPRPVRGVRVVAPTVSPALRPRRWSAERAPSARSSRRDLDGVRLVVTATGVADVDAAVAAARHGRRALGQRRRPARRLLVHPPGDRPQRPADRRRRAPAAPARPSPAACATTPVALLDRRRRRPRRATWPPSGPRSGPRGGSTEDVDWSRRDRRRRSRRSTTIRVFERIRVFVRGPLARNTRMAGADRGDSGDAGYIRCQFAQPAGGTA